MAGLIYATEPYAGWIFLALTVILGGGLATATGRGIAQTWRPFAAVALYMVPLAMAIRFLHFALFEEKLLSAQYFIVAYAVLLACGTLGYLQQRAEQMTRQYPWLHEKTGFLGWRKKDPGAPAAP